MSAIVITGTGYVAPDSGGPHSTGLDSAGPAAFLAAGFDPEAELGRRTSRFNHRGSLLAVAACGAALRAAGLEPDTEDPDAIGVTLGTTCGSLTGSVTFGWDTFAQPRPYNVDPSSFPNLVINAAAGAAAIRYGLRGPNTTVAGGPVAGIVALRHAVTTLRAGHADTILAGATEEYGAWETWLAAATRPGAVLGEGAAVLVAEHEEVAMRAGRTPVAVVGSVLTRAVDVTEPGGLRALIADALTAASRPPGQVCRLAVRLTGHGAADRAAAQAADLLPVSPVYSEHLIGDCQAAHAAIQLADTVTAARDQGWSSDDAGVVLAVDPDGLAGVAVLTGPSALTGLSALTGPSASESAAAVAAQRTGWMS
jgi:3-oxoacyl-[acyl-carrier-protein] synthase II